MVKNGKITIEKLTVMITKGFSNMEERMATKADLSETEHKLEKRLDKIEVKIDSVADSIQHLEEGEILDLQRRVFVLER